MRSIPNTRPSPVEVTTSGGAASTPSTANSGTSVNDDFNALIRKVEARKNSLLPDEVVFKAFQDAGWSNTLSNTILSTLALRAVLSLRDAGFDL